MTWNYRVIRREDEIYAIHEVHYNKDGKPSGVTVEPSWPQGETLEELQRDFEHYQEALQKEVLNYEDF